MSGAKIGRRGFLGAAGLLMAAPSLSLAANGKPRVAIKTSRGTIVVELEAEKAPLTTHNFLRYVTERHYDGGSFFRAARDPQAPKEGTIVGAPNPHTHPFPPIKHESTTMTGLRHVAGTISLGRFEPGTATSDFFICASDEPYLDAHPGAPGDNLGYAAFGHVVEGMPVVARILASPTDRHSKFKDQRGQWLKPPIPILSMRQTA
jgi:peptidyl-prolyl cis-trans isomerase A (cyclophilin A)